MNDLTFENRILASKRLARTKLQFTDDLLSLNVIWCRTAYNGNENWTKKQHCHTFFELQFPLTGENVIKIEEKTEHTVHAGQFLMIPPKVRHQIMGVSDDFSKFVFGFYLSFQEQHTDSPYFKAAFNSVSPYTIYTANERMSFYVEMLLRYSFEQKPGFITAASKTLELLLLEIASQVKQNYSEYSYKKNIFEQNIRMDTVDKFISDNLSGKITSTEVARQINISTKQLNRIAKKETGHSIGELIKIKKIEEIKKLLETTDLSLQQIAETCGYANEFNLIRFFKQIEGLTPGKYRESLKM